MKKFSFRNNSKSKSIQQTPASIWDKCVVKLRTPNLPIHEFTSVISQLNSINFPRNQRIITQQDAFDLIFRISQQSQTSDVELCTNICRLCMTLFLKVHVKPQGEKLPTITRYFLNMIKNLLSYKAEPMKVLGQLLFTSGKHLSDLYDEIINLLLQYTTPTNPDFQLRETALMCCMTFTSHVSNYLNYTPIITTFLDVFKSFDYTSILSQDVAKMISHACLGFHSLAIQIQPKAASKDVYKVSRGVVLREEIKAINEQLLPLVPEIIKYIIKYKYIYYDAEKIKQYNTAIEPNKSVLEKELQDAVRVRKHAAMCLQVLFPLEPLQLQTYWSDLLPYNNFLIVNTTTYSLLWLLKYDPVTDEFGQFIRLIQIIFTHLKLPILLMNFKVPTNIYSSSKTDNIYYMILNVHKQLTELFTKNLNYKEIISPLLLCFKTFMEQKVPYNKIDAKKSLSGSKTNNYQHLMDMLTTSYKVFDTNESDVFLNAYFFWKIVYTSEYNQIIIDLFLKSNSRYCIPNKLIERIGNWRMKSRQLNENLKKNEKKIVIRSIDHLAVIFKNYSSIIEEYFETIYSLLQINLFSSGDRELIPHSIGIVAAFYQSKENFSLYAIPENSKKTIKGSVIQLLGYIISSLGLVSSEARKAAVGVFNCFSNLDYNNLSEANRKTLINYILALIDDNDIEIRYLSFQTLSSLIQRVYPEVFYEIIYTTLFNKLKIESIATNERLLYCLSYTIGTLLIVLKQTNYTNMNYITHDLYDILMKYKNIGSDIRCYIGLFFTSFLKREEKICLIENIIPLIHNDYQSKKLIIMLKDIYFLLSNMTEEEIIIYKNSLYKIFLQFNDIISKTKIIDIEIYCFKCLSLVRFTETLPSEYGRICYLNCLLALNKIYTLKPTEREKYSEKINSLLEILSIYTIELTKHIEENDFNELSKDYLHILAEWINKMREEENSEEMNDLDIFLQRIVALST